MGAASMGGLSQRTIKLKSVLNRGIGGLIEPFFALMFLVYAAAFYKRISDYWFHPGWTTDDSLQQLYPLHAVVNPGLYEGDLITEVMRAYLLPLHYWLSVLITLVTKDPIMTGHWVMLIQIVLSVLFVFLAVRAVGGNVPALFAATWLLHTRHVMQRLTSGLPRGWTPVIIAAFFYFVLTKRHKCALFIIFLGAFLHPAASLICIASYGLYLGISFLQGNRLHYWRQMVGLVLISGLTAIVAFYAVERPAKIGPMVSLEQAEQMPQFSKPHGRFPFLPFREPWDEITKFGFQSFLTRFYSPGKFLKTYTPYMVVAALALMLSFASYTRKEIIPKFLVCYGLAAVLVYFASRLLAFHLYVPDRHLQIPWAMFFVTAFSLGVWNMFRSLAPTGRERLLGALGLVLLGYFIVLNSGSGLQGAMNFNWSADKTGGAFSWIRQNTPLKSVVAGHPTYIDPVQLYGQRQGFVTTETSHPFFPVFYQEMDRRLRISLKAHYAPSLKSLVEVLEPEGVDFFVFERQQFYPDMLGQATYFVPLDQFTRELASSDQFAYRELPTEVDLKRFPFMPFKDKRAVVVDIAKLKLFLRAQG